MTFRAEQGHKRVLAIVAGIHYLTKPTDLDVLINTINVSWAAATCSVPLLGSSGYLGY